MQSEKIYNILNKFIHIITPLIILIYTYFSNINYNSTQDHGGWGGLAMATIILSSIAWILAILFIVFVFNYFLKKESSKRIVKLIISILNIIIWVNIFHLLYIDELLLILNILLVIITTILLFFNIQKVRKNEIQ